MRVLVTLAATVLVAIGCVDREPASIGNHGYGWQYDVLGETGMMLRLAPAGGYGLAQYEADYVSVESCLGIEAPGPFVVQVDTLPIPDATDTAYGITYLDNGTVVVYATPMNLQLTSHVARHEFIHYLLWTQAFPEPLQRAHDHWAFGTCDRL